MDASRFDSLTRSLTARLTRRGGLGLLGALGLGARIDLAGIDAKKKKKKKKKKKPPCTVSSNGTATTTSLTATVKDLSLTTTDTSQHAGGGLTSTTVIRQKRALVLQMNASVQPGGLGTVEILYGKAYKGIARANLTSDGQTVSGTIDGRAIVPFAASAQPTSIQFQDGQPAPTMSLSPKLYRLLTQLYTKAEAQAGACSGVSAELHTSRLCLTCVGGCGGGATLCLFGAKKACAAASVLCVFGAPACFAGCMAVGLVTCGLSAEVCVDICARNPCCAVPCHHTNGDPFCCEGGQTCLRPGVCCGAGQTPCGGRNCCPSPDRCVAGGECCLHPNFPCGQNCCGPFSGICCNGVCCNGVCLPNGSCCASPSRRCGNGPECCTSDRACCGDACCAAGLICVNNQCIVPDPCPGANLCAGQCCPQGRACCSGVCCAAEKVCCGTPSRCVDICVR
jgi:hypothetical protein